MQIKSLKTITLFLLVFLTACSGMLNFSPERAAVHNLLSDQWMGRITDPNSIQVLQKAEVEDISYVFLSYQATNDLGQVLECTYLYETYRRFGVWAAGSGGGGCGPLLENQDVIGLGSGSHSRDGKVVSQVYGLVYSPTVARIEVTWDDGHVQEVEPVNDSYLAIRLTAAHLKRVEAFDTQDLTLYLMEHVDSR